MFQTLAARGTGAALLCAAAAFAPSASAGYTYTLVPNSLSSWGSLSDATLGIAGYQVESFESRTLNANVRIGWTAQGITSLPSSTLPRTFTPPVDDLAGTAFVAGGLWGGGVWAGERGIINFFGNGPVPAGGYSPSPNVWGAIRIEFAQPVRSVGFSFQQAELPTQLSIDGAAQGTLQGLFGFPTNGQRAGYLRIDGTGGDTISFIDLFNNCPTGQHGQGGCDGWMIDYLAFDLPQTGVVPVPASLPLFAAGLGALGWSLRRRR